MKLVWVVLWVVLTTSRIFEGKVLWVIDGDTFVFQTEEGSLRVRMDGIDAPEKDQAFGPEATKFLNGYLHRKGELAYKGVDRYGRTLGVLFLDGVNVNLLLVEKGFAWHYKKYSQDTVLARAEINARRERIGLWKEGNAVAPWEWRRR